MSAQALEAATHARAFGTPGQPTPRGLRDLLGEPAWQRLPAAVRERFGDPSRTVDYVGRFDIVRANLAGRALAWLCQLLGTPVVPRTGRDVPAIVHVSPSGRGVDWTREYCWPEPPPSLVRSTKVIAPDGSLVEELPAHLCMQLAVHEAAGALHFISRCYYFSLPIPLRRDRLKLFLPRWLSPGTVHVEHRDEAGGWFRFTMTVTHPMLGELFYQTGRFHAQGD